MTLYDELYNEFREQNENKSLVPGERKVACVNLINWFEFCKSFKKVNEMISFAQSLADTFSLHTRVSNFNDLLHYGSNWSDLTELFAVI